MDIIEYRTLQEAELMFVTGITLRQVAKIVGLSKSTVHKDLTEVLPQLDEELYKNVKKILEKNKAERHIRGGRATKIKYLKLKSE